MDEYPEAAFFNAGTIDDVKRKAEELKKGGMWMAAMFQLDVLAASVPLFRASACRRSSRDGRRVWCAGRPQRDLGAVCAGELQFETEDGEHRLAAVAPSLFKSTGDRVLLLLDAAG